MKSTPVCTRPCLAVPCRAVPHASDCRASWPATCSPSGPSHAGRSCIHVPYDPDLVGHLAPNRALSRMGDFPSPSPVLCTCSGSIDISMRSDQFQPWCHLTVVYCVHMCGMPSSALAGSVSLITIRHRAIGMTLGSWWLATCSTTRQTTGAQASGLQSRPPVNRFKAPETAARPSCSELCPTGKSVMKSITSSPTVAAPRCLRARRTMSLSIPSRTFP